MQLKASAERRAHKSMDLRVWLSSLSLSWLCIASPTNLSVAHAEQKIRGTTSFVREGGNPVHMTVVSPQVQAATDVGDWLALDLGWTADIVSGASVSVVDAPSSEVDVISTATKLSDFRQTVGGGIALRRDTTTIRAGYTYGFENDYRSHALEVSASTELFQRNTRFNLSYARGFDSVCALSQPEAKEAVDRRRMPSSDGCFSNAERSSLALNLQTFQLGWTQNWTSVWATQLTATSQLLDGFQSNPYRAVWLGRTAALEFHPEHRIRHSVGLASRYWVEPLGGALKLALRGYRDSWDIRSFTADVAYEQDILAGLSLMGRVRFYTQNAASFYSDDYTRFPKGAYFTGDRELSSMRSRTLGLTFTWTPPASDEGYIGGLFQSFYLVLKGDLTLYSFPDFHYRSVAVPNDQSFLVTAAVEAVF